MNSEMSEPKWEELDMDCLVNIFGRLGLESLVLDVLFVCKSWCPALRTLVLPSNVLQGPQFKIQNHMSKWTSLQSLKLQRCFDMEELLTQISIHCKSFVALAIETANIGKDEASAIVNFLPNIKVLVLRDCTGFTESDEEILKHASRIRSFKHEGSMGSMSFYFSYRSVDGFRW
ncbi:uncharacterized protein LOC130770956 isoform X5 [Actinidia eriantha]|uniref:uncharacterized protein LOC130770956 isoform X5 n=1 Tax=Actinidia eriantha TaxID=165200 RepID=UPI0025891327|nr:uncharacterized protein LOC130770956 isoform X5 [Actinidia eriantha]